MNIKDYSSGHNNSQKNLSAYTKGNLSYLFSWNSDHPRSPESEGGNLLEYGLSGRFFNRKGADF